MRPASSAASVKPRACSSGFSGLIHSPVGCWAILRICSARSFSPDSSRAATCRAALPSGLTQKGSASFGCCVIRAPAFSSLPSPSPDEEQPASSSAAPSATADARLADIAPAPLLPYIRPPWVHCSEAQS